jgi:hypothetical protein
VQRIGKLNLFFGVEMKPLLGFSVPADAESLQATVGELDQVLLERFDSEGVLNGIRLADSVRSLRGRPELLSFSKKSRLKSVIIELCFVEIA